MKFEEFITRIDEEIIQEIIGKNSVKILNIIDTDLTRVSKLQNAILKVYSPVELFKIKKIRDSFFDLLRPHEAETLLENLGRPLSADNYASLKQLKFNTPKDFLDLLNYFEIEEVNAEEPIIQPKESISSSQYPLFPYQRKAVREIDGLALSGSKRLLLHMPTGSGKTRTAMNVICNQFRFTEPTVVLWLAHTEELCGQAAEEFEKAWKNIGNRDLHTIRYWGDSDADISEIRDGFVVGGLMKVFNLLKKDASAISKLGSHTSLIIMDEAHMAIAPTFKDTLDILLSFGARLVGLSATPGRTWNSKDEDQKLSDFFRRTKVTLKVDGYENPVDYLVEKGYLAKIKNSPLFYNSGIKISEKDLQYLNSFLELPESFLFGLSEDQARNILIVQKVEELVSRHKRILVFGLNVAHSNLLATCLQVRNINAYSLTSNTDPDQRKSLIRQFKSDNDEHMVLCNYGILTTGFDAPKTSCAVICRPTDSLVLYSQMVGRAIRGITAGGNEEAEIVTVIDTMLPGFDQVQNAFFNWEDVW